MKNISTTILLFGFFYFQLQAQKIWCVNQLASGPSDGKSWQHAFPDLQQALALAGAELDLRSALGGIDSEEIDAG